MFLLLILQFATSFYNLSFTDCAGNEIVFEKFIGKKILIVNSASSSRFSSQLDSLAELQHRYDSSLIIVVMPSNSFGHEPKSADQLLLDCQKLNTPHLYFSLPVKVYGEGQHSVYKWLTNLNENLVTSDPVTEDFKKFLISRKGEMIGAFSAAVNPLSQELTNAIELAD